ncbi:MAG: hypothetical protein M0036_20860 [Desulfobacteraceae bacterium]|nr:hypothetical protein [Desulfobacteraceae bacterium]
MAEEKFWSEYKITYSFKGKVEKFEANVFYQLDELFPQAPPTSASIQWHKSLT